MTEDMAIRAGKKVPDTHEEMAIVNCDHVDCDAAFSIVHHSGYGDMARAKRQVTHVKGILHDEHVRPEFKDHFKSYDLEDVD
jgi:hypothetical protein